MTVSAHARPPSARRAEATFAPLVGGLALLALISASLVLALLPLSASAIRVGRLSLGWWYTGVAAPLVGWGLAVWACPPAPRPDRAAPPPAP